VRSARLASPVSGGLRLLIGASPIMARSVLTALSLLVAIIAMKKGKHLPPLIVLVIN
jgi:hypothetical protein